MMNKWNGIFFFFAKTKYGRKIHLAAGVNREKKKKVNEKQIFSISHKTN